MKQVNNGFDPQYYLTEQGQVYNSKTKQIIYKNQKRFQLKTTDGKRKSTNLKLLYRLVYNKNFCVDNIENLPKEIWKEISGTDGYYQVSSCGRVKSLKGYEAKLMSQRLHQNKYYRTDIIIDGINRSMLVHKLVAMAFLENDKGYDAQIHHIDGNGFNNNVKNLMFITVAEHRAIHKKKDIKENEKE